MPFPLLIPLITAAASGIAGSLSNRKSARTSTATPTTAPEDVGIANLLRDRLTTRLNTPFNLTGYETQGIQGINDAYSGITQSINNNLTARGLGSSPVAGTAMTNLNLARGGEQARFLNTLPQIQRGFEDQDINNIQAFLNARRGTQTVGAGSALGSGLGSAAEMMAFLAGQGLLRR